jgi:tetratricopeptide (TPR) repeat protein
VNLKIGNETVSTWGIHHVYRVRRVQSEWVWVVAGRLAGWVQRSDLLPLDRAIEYYSDTVRRHPDAAWAYLGRGLVWHTRHEFELALADFDKAIRSDPRLAPAYNNRALTRAALNDPRGALADLDKSLDLDPLSALALANRGILKLDQGDPGGAQVDLEVALALDPTLAFAHDAQGDLALARGDFLGARVGYLIADQHDPDLVLRFERLAATPFDRDDRTPTIAAAAELPQGGAYSTGVAGYLTRYHGLKIHRAWPENVPREARHGERGAGPQTREESRSGPRSPRRGAPDRPRLSRGASEPSQPPGRSRPR